MIEYLLFLYIFTADPFITEEVLEVRLCPPEVVYGQFYDPITEQDV